MDLPLAREGITLQEFFHSAKKGSSLKKISWLARALIGLRIALGRIFGWDKERDDELRVSFSERLTEEDQAALQTWG